MLKAIFILLGYFVGFLGSMVITQALFGVISMWSQVPGIIGMVMGNKLANYINNMHNVRCPYCNKSNCSVSTATNPPIWRCDDCKYTWEGLRMPD